jgi:hypothetical protein
MPRVEKNAAGEDVPVDTPEFGCIVIEPTPPAPATKTKAAAKAAAPEGETE